MKLKTLIPLCALLLGLSPLAHANKTITFNVPVKLEKLDPQVTGIYVYCYLHGNAAYPSFNTVAPVNGGYNGTLQVAITVPTADMGKTDNWSCTLRLNGPGAPAGVAANHPESPWSKVLPGAVTNVSGKF
jgi:hypothetical protein